MIAGQWSEKNVQENPVQEELGETMYTPAGCGGRRRVRLVGLARGGVTEQGPVAAVIVVADHKVKTCEHGKEKSLELQESMTPVGGPFGGTELGPLGLGREGESLAVVRHSRLLRCCSMPLRRRRAGWTRHVPRTLRAHLAACRAPHLRLEKKKEVLELSNSQRELGEVCRCGPDDTRGCAGRRWTLGTALDQRRLTRTAATLLDGSAYQGHSLKEALG